MDGATAPIGHNLPPDPLEILRDNLAEKHVDLYQRGQALTAMGERLPDECTSPETEAKLIHAIKQCNAYAGTSGAVEAARKVAKQPHLDAGVTVDAWFKGLSRPVALLGARMNELLTAYQRKKADEERKRREAAEAEARKAAAEAAAKMKSEADLDAAVKAEAAAEEARRAAAAKPAEMSRTKTDFGVTSSLRTTWRFEVADAAQVPRQYLIVNDAAIRAAVKAHVSDDGKRCDLTIPGVRIYPDTQSVVR